MAIKKDMTDDGGKIIRKGSFVWWFRRLMGMIGAILAGLFLGALFVGQESLSGPVGIGIAIGSAALYVIALRKIIFGKEQDVRYNDEV